MKVLVTGAAGFIGFHVSARLLARGDTVVGLDNLNPYYDVRLKRARVERLTPNPRFEFVHLDLTDQAGMEAMFVRVRPERVVHLGAQAGVRHAFRDPHAYVHSNLVGFLHVLEGCRKTAVQHLVYASSSSVYGANTKPQFSVHDNVDHPVSLYAATKKANELMAHTYSHGYGLPATGVRFFTVYGPWGRPDMAPFLFTKAILAGEPITVFNHGDMQRDFTYIDDAVEAAVRLLDRLPKPDPAWSGLTPDPGSSTAPYRVYNVGNHRQIGLLRFIEVLEQTLGRPAEKRLVPMQPGDVPATCADVTDIMRDVGYSPATPIEEGIPRFVEWYRGYYGV